MPIEVRQLGPGDIPLMRALLTAFGEAFSDMETYTANPPGHGYLERLLGGDTFIVLAALKRGEVVGGIAAYELKKFEQERSEIYIYDLAVAARHRREGIATALINGLRKLAVSRGASAIFVQADTGVEDEAAIALYSRMGKREKVLHFDILVKEGYMNVTQQIKAYIDGQPEAKRGDLQALHRLILAAMPKRKLWFLDGKDANGKTVSNPNIGYGFQTMQLAGGKTREFYRIGLSANTAGISVYILGIEDKAYLAKTYGKKLGKAAVTGYCIKFKSLKDIDTEVLDAAIRDGFQDR